MARLPLEGIRLHTGRTVYRGDFQSAVFNLSRNQFVSHVYQVHDKQESLKSDFQTKSEERHTASQERTRQSLATYQRLLFLQ